MRNPLEKIEKALWEEETGLLLTLPEKDFPAAEFFRLNAEPLLHQVIFSYSDGLKYLLRVCEHEPQTDISGMWYDWQESGEIEEGRYDLSGTGEGRIAWTEKGHFFCLLMTEGATKEKLTFMAGRLEKAMHGMENVPSDKRDPKSVKEISKFIALILRHKPEAAGITLDEHGWASVQDMIEGINATGKHHLDVALLEEIVQTDEKQRYSYNEDHTLIRANQGHSVPVDVELEEKTPPVVLYHGTGEKFAASIEEQGLIPKSRLYVHLSADIGTAKTVGSRHGKPVVYAVDCERMVKDGYVFFLSVNQVWLTKAVPVEYLRRM